MNSQQPDVKRIARQNGGGGRTVSGKRIIGVKDGGSTFREPSADTGDSKWIKK